MCAAMALFKCSSVAPQLRLGVVSAYGVGVNGVELKQNQKENFDRIAIPYGHCRRFAPALLHYVPFSMIKMIKIILN